MGFFAPGSLIYAQSDKPAETQARPTSQAATEEEVAQLREEVAELKAIIQQLVQASSKVAPGEAHPVQANFIPESAQPDAPSSLAEVTPSDVDGLQKEINVLQKKASDAPLETAGWNGENFYL